LSLTSSTRKTGENVVLNEDFDHGYFEGTYYECRACERRRAAARQRRVWLANVLLVASFLCGLTSLWVVGEWDSLGLGTLGIFITFGLLWMAAEVDRA
jgi:hypothetical protein